MRQVLRIAMTVVLISCNAGAVVAPEEPTGQQYPFLVQMDRSPTVKDSAAAFQLGARRILRLPLARAMTLEFGGDFRPQFNQRAGVTGVFYLTSLDQTAPVDFIYSSPPTPAQLAAVAAVAKYPLQVLPSDTLVKAWVRYEAINGFGTASGVVAASIYPYFYFLF